ncbi:Sbal_3080 family lipoprotein [Azoarcus olearius]
MTVVIAASIGAAGCTHIDVTKMDARKHPLSLVCIEENPNASATDIVSVIEDGFQRRGILTAVYSGNAPSECEYSVWYLDEWGWDLAPYMRRAEIRLRRKAVTVARATYVHSGGLALNKWAGTKSKLEPVIDQLLAGYEPVLK